MVGLKVLEIEEGVHFAHTWLSSWVILHDELNVVLIDSGYPGQRVQVAASLRAAGLERRQVDAVLLTHAHIDHVGNAAYLEGLGARVIASPGVAAAIRRPKLEQIRLQEIVSHLWRPRHFLWTVRAILAGGLRWTPVRSVEIATPEVLNGLPFSPSIHATEGHAVGHSSYVLSGGRIVATGDAIVSSHPIAGRASGVSVLPAIFNKDHTRTVTDARALPVAGAIILPGHGMPVRHHG